MYAFVNATVQFKARVEAQTGRGQRANGEEEKLFPDFERLLEGGCRAVFPQWLKVVLGGALHEMSRIG
ncbi:hypothetical protein LNK20_21325, partial [Bacillus safensis]|nr:hypothetical protein [Bacillus safensis]